MAVKAPRSNSTRTIGSAATKSATAAGSVRSSANSSARFSLSMRGGVIAGAELVAELGQQHDADGDADHAERQLEQPVGVIEPGHHAILERGDDGVEHHGDLGHAAGDRRRARRARPAGACRASRRGRAQGQAHADLAAATATTITCSTPETAMPQASATPAVALLDVAEGDQRRAARRSARR